MDTPEKQSADDTAAPLTLRDDLRTNKWWGGVVIAGFAFVVTCLAAVVSTLGDPQSPMNTVFASHGTTLFGVEAAVLMFSCIAAMTVDRRQTLRDQRPEQTETEMP
ncbi:MAG: hypothetical protein KDA52_06665 [Planctomycetaceae bacterium]|nr:hypothetical protein [Planctomycetaceae bacterium]